MPHLPDELIEQIASELGHYSEQNLRTLRSLSLVNRAFHRVVQPYLYSQVDTVAKDGSAKLFRTLIHNPELGHWVKTLRADSSPLTDAHRKSAKFDDFVAALDDVKNNFNSTKYYQALFSFIFVFLPNIERLIVQHAKSPAKQRPWLLWLSIPPFNPRFNTPNFTKLKHVDADIRGICLADLYPIFQLPSIERLHFTGGELAMPLSDSDRLRYKEIWHDLRANNSPKTVKRLSFVHVSPSTELHGFHYIAMVCPSLEALSVIGKKGKGLGSYLYRAIIRTFMGPLTNPEFRYLELWDERTTWPSQWTVLHAHTAMQTFAAISTVRHLELDHGILACLWDHLNMRVTLPPHVQTLQLRSVTLGNRFYFATTMSRLLSDLAMTTITGNCPDLKFVQVELQAHDHITTSQISTVQAAFNIKGVQCIFKDKADKSSSLSRVFFKLLS